jgi:hypothetical protein
MSSLHEVLCPRCGAPVPPTAPEQRVVVCHFCQHEYEVEHAQAAARPHPSSPEPDRDDDDEAAPSSPPPHHHHHHHARKPQPSSSGGVGVVAVLGIVAAVGGVVAYGVSQNKATATPEHEHDIDWDSAGDPPTFVDVNGDGTEDFLGSYWKPEKGEARGDHSVKLGAFDGASHNSLWIAGPFGRSTSAKGVVHFGVANRRVALADLAAVVHILDVANGKEVSTVKLPDRARAACAIPNRPEVWFDVLGDKSVTIDVMRAVATPALRPAACPEAPPGSCQLHRGRSTCLPATRAPAVAGFRADRVLAEGTNAVAIGVGDPNPGLAGAKAKTGPTVTAPLLVGFDVTTGAVHWQSGIGTSTQSSSSSTTPLTAPSSVAEISSGRIYTQYELKNGSWRLASFDLKTGQQLWDVKVLGNKHGDEARAMVLSSSRVYLAHGDWLDLFDLKTGQQLGNFGK